MKKKKYLLEETYQINKNDLNEDWKENALLLAGFVPVIGEVADLISIYRYVKQERYIEAGLMLFALIPTVGDFISKPLIKLIGASRAAAKSPKVLVELLEKSPALKNKFLGLGKYVDNPNINKLIKQVSDKAPSIGQGLTKSKSTITNILDVLEKGVGKSTKSAFQTKNLAKYVAKHGTVPPNKLSYWFNVTRLARRDRRMFINNLLKSNNLLGHLGIYNFEDLDNAINDSRKREQLANDPNFQRLVDQVTTPEEMQQLLKGDVPQQEEEPDMLDGLKADMVKNMGLSGIKMLAKFI